MKNRILTTLFITLFCTLPVLAQTIQIDKLEPANWWIGFKNPELQLLVYGPNISESVVSLEYPGVRLKSVEIPENPNYLFINLEIGANAKAGILPLVFTNGNETEIFDYPLLEKSSSNSRIQGFDASDVIYLIMPDRFANGDPTNDTIPGMLEESNRDQPYGRHGGDLKGIQNNLDYIHELGMTAIWLNPIFENDMPADYQKGVGFYHGYAATDMYKVDRRFGSNEEFKSLIESAQSRGMKVIMDMIHNHVGTEHWFVKDLPSKDWIHDQSVHGNTNFRTGTVMDPYASDFDRNAMVKGWFVDEMPDLDQRNEFVVNYLIQNTLWWIEYSGIDGIRMDTHPYPYKEYMAEWTRRVLEEYPQFNIVGEAWAGNVPTTAFWQRDFPDKSGYNSFLPSITDFPMNRAVNQAFTEEFGWETGVSKLYDLLGQDFLYSDPLLNVIFLDNHDLNRFFSTVGEDPRKAKMGIAFILTTRGIPQVYYGTEILMPGEGMDPNKRYDFPGGWESDTHNAFLKSGRIALGLERGFPVDETFDYVKKIANWRKNASAIHNGRLTHFIPANNTYVYFRHNDEQRVLVAINASEDSVTLDYRRYSELLEGYSGGQEITSGTRITDLKNIQVPGMTAFIIELN